MTSLGTHNGGYCPFRYCQVGHSTSRTVAGCSVRLRRGWVSWCEHHLDYCSPKGPALIRRCWWVCWTCCCYRCWRSWTWTWRKTCCCQCRLPKTCSPISEPLKESKDKKEKIDFVRLATGKLAMNDASLLLVVVVRSWWWCWCSCVTSCSRHHQLLGKDSLS